MLTLRMSERTIDNLKTAAIWAVIAVLTLCLAVVAHGQQTLAPFYTSQTNTNIYVNMGAGSPYTTIAKATTKACTAPASFLVILLPGANPADSIGGQTGVCNGVVLIDYTAVPAVTYKGNGTVYASQGGGGGCSGPCVTTFNGRNGAVTLTEPDIAAAIGGSPMTGQVPTWNGSAYAPATPAAGSPPQTQYAVPAYLLSPSGGLASPGASHLSVDPTGYNLSGYHSNFTNLGVNAAQADCTAVGALFGGHSCMGLSATYSGDTGVNEWGSTINLNAYGPGQNLGNDGSPNSRINDAFGLYENIRARGGNAANSITMFGSRVGDWGPWYVYDFDDGGTQAPSDEGTKVIGTYEGGETFGYFHGTVLTGGSGATLPTFNFTGGCGGFNACTPTDGGILLDTQTAVASGYLTGPSVDVSTGSVPLKALPVSATLPITTAWGHAEGLSIAATADRNITAPATIAMTMVTGSFSPGDHVCVEGVGPSGVGGFDEQSIVTTVSGGSITLPLAYPYSAIAIFTGGPCGTYISFSADLALNGYRTSYHAIASFTGSDLIYAVPSDQGLNATIGSGLPQFQAEPETTGGTSDPNAAFQTFCGAEIDEALAPNNSDVQIDPNGCAWTIGDTVESPHFPTQSVSGLYALINQNMPNNGHGTGGTDIELQGMGVAGYTWGHQVENLNSNAWYVNGGGHLAEPQCAYCVAGTWFNDLRGTAPSDSILRVTGHLPGQTGYNIFEDSIGGFGGIISLNAAGFTFSTSVNTAGGFNGGGVGVTGGISTESLGDGASITDINGALTNATPSFTQAGYQGSRADFGAVAYGATTPVTPLLTVVTDSSFGGIDGDVFYTYNGATKIPFLLVGNYNDYPGTPESNLSLENGVTHCAELICLGPTATVDSSGNTVVNNLTINGTCTGCGAGGSSYFPGTSTVTVSGTPTTGQVLTATSGTAANWQTPTGGGGGGNYTNLCSLVTLTNATCSSGLIIPTSGHNSFTVSAIPHYLTFVYNITGSFSGALDPVGIAFNGDTTSGDYTCYWTGAGTTGSTCFSYQTAILGWLGSSTGMGVARGTISNYSTTSPVMVTGSSYASDVPANYQNSVWWNSTAAITSIMIGDWSGFETFGSNVAMTLYGTD